VEFSLNSGKIVQNISDLARKNVSIFCLQEVARQKNQPFIIDLILKKLGPKWREIHHLGTGLGSENMGNCIIWNSAKLTLEKQAPLNLKAAKKPALHEWAAVKLAGAKPKLFQRRSIAGCFSFNHQKFKIMNIHLDHMGGVRHRAKQLKSVLEQNIFPEVETYEIICGDFNNLDVTKFGKQNRLVRKIFGESFSQISAHIDWTADVYNVNVSTVSRVFKFFLKFFKIHFRRRLDAIWVKGLTAVNCYKIDVAGSDHYPILAEVKL
jgi:endonuclease/exonuclease/phosphatase family metal-dependent hydrolase